MFIVIDKFGSISDKIGFVYTLSDTTTYDVKPKVAELGVLK